jgi:ADP-ribose pyrophosphatase YjhB (NUDIX family)
MIYHQPPSDFNQAVTVIGCFLVHDGKILLLKGAKAPRFGLWCVPGGEVKEDELDIETLVREVKEQTGLEIDGYFIEWFSPFYVRYPKSDFIYKLCRVVLPPTSRHRWLPIHTAYLWQTPEKALQCLIEDEAHILKLCYNLF